MHPSVISSDDIDYNLYPALLQVFVIVLMGYAAAHLRIITKSQALGLNKFVGKFALPALLFRNIATLDFSVVNWYFLTSIFVSKSIVFFGALFFTLLAIRPVNLGLAGIFAIFVSQSNDFALGFPIVNAIYSKTHPDYIHYIYLIAPISLCILNPIAFFMLEANENINQIKELTSGGEAIRAKLNKSDHEYRDEEAPQKAESEDENDFEDIDLDDEHDNDDDKKKLVTRIQASLTKKNSQDVPRTSGAQLKLESPHGSDPVNGISTPNTSGSFESSFVNPQSSNTLTSTQVNSLSSETLSRQISTTSKFSNRKIIKATILSTIQNPIVFMTFIGVIANFLLNQHIPVLVKPILDLLADTFGALALFYLGFTMVGKINNLRLTSILVILILIFTKSILFPLITREAVLHIQNLRTLPANASHAQTDAFNNETESLSTFGFLYGTFPTAPSLFFYMTQYKYINSDLISAALVFGTLASAPLMMVSGKMIALQINNTQVNNFEDIECKTAYGFGLLTWFACLWVVYIFLASGRLFRRPHRYTFFLIISQMANALVHILWTHLSPTQNKSDIATASSLPGYLHVIFGLFTSYLTRCWPLAIMLNIISIYCDLRIRSTQSVIHVGSNRNMIDGSASRCPARCSNQLSAFFQSSHVNRFILNYLARSRFVSVFVGLLVPVFTTALCIITSASIPRQGMMISLGKPQIIISIVLLASISSATIYLVFLFIRFKNIQDNQNQQRKRSRFENQSVQSSALSVAPSKSSTLTEEYGPLRYAVDGNARLETSNELAAQSTGMKQESEKQNLLDQSDEDENDELNGDDLRRVNRRRRNLITKSTPDSKRSNASTSSKLITSNEEEEVERNTDSKPFSNETDKQYQLMQHLALVIVMTFNSLMCMFFQMWSLFDENKSAIYYELELIDLTLLYGQGFFTFLMFGFDNKYVVAPIFFKFKELFNLIEKFKLPQIEHVPAETLEVCRLFEAKYKNECIRKTTRDQRFHYKFYKNVFTGSDMVDWLLRKGLVKTRRQGVDFGRKLVISRVIHHVSHNRHFYDNYNFYRFNESS